MFRIPMGRYRSESSNKTNCVTSRTNVTVCETTSRTFGKVLVTTSSAIESLINELDVRNNNIDSFLTIDF